MAAAQRTSPPRRAAQPRRPAATTARTSAKSTGTAGAPAGRRKSVAQARAPRPTKQAGVAATPPRPAQPGGPEQKKSWPLRSTAVTLPVVKLRVPVPGADIQRSAAVARTRWAGQALRANLPPVERLAYYGGLTMLAVAGVLEWPVAAVAAAGVWVASRSRRAEGGVAPR